MRLVYKNTELDYIEFMKYILEIDKKTKNKFLIIPILAIIYGFFLAFKYKIINDPDIILTFIIYNIGCFFIGLYLYSLDKIILIKFKLKLKHAPKELFEEKVIEIIDDNIIYKNNINKKNIINLDSIKDVVENNNRIYILRKKGYNYINTPIIPIEIFENDYDKQKFINMFYDKR